MSKLKVSEKRATFWMHTDIGHPNGIKLQIYYIMINKKWINSVYNCKEFKNVYSDHRIIIATFKLILGQIKR